jgi:hypothetical protein
MENHYLENRQIHVRVLFKTRGSYNYQIFWKVYTIQDTFEFYKKGNYGFVYLSKNSKPQISRAIKERIESLGCGSATVIMNDLCVSTGGTEHYKMNIEVLANDMIFRRLKTDSIIQSL